MVTYQWIAQLVAVENGLQSTAFMAFFIIIIICDGLRLRAVFGVLICLVECLLVVSCLLECVGWFAFSFLILFVKNISVLAPQRNAQICSVE